MTVARGEGAWRLGGKGEGTEECRLVVAEQSRGWKVQRRECSQSYCNNYGWCQVGTGNTGGTTV